MEGVSYKKLNFLEGKTDSFTDSFLQGQIDSLLKGDTDNL